MPARITPIVTGEIYHVVNRGNGSIPIFKSGRYYNKFLEIISYYKNSIVSTRLSKFNLLSIEDRQYLLKEMSKNKDFLVDIIAFCLMPNHIHLLLKQIKDNGILKFMRLSSDSYSKYFNVKNERKGSLFEGRFRATRIETNEQLLHVSRYIHLNPYSSYIIKDIKNLTSYPYSSLPEYLGHKENNICSKDIISDQFKSIEEYKQFLFDQADYQRSLDLIKHQLLE
jgi:putative transposase